MLRKKINKQQISNSKKNKFFRVKNSFTQNILLGIATILFVFFSYSLSAVQSENTKIALPCTSMYGQVYPVNKIAGFSKGAMGITIKKNYLYAIGSGKLIIYDISQPDNPRQLGSLSGLFRGRQIAITNNIACITARANGLYLVDVSNPRKPELITRFDTIELATGVDAVWPVVFVTSRVYGIECIDISDPKFPRHVSLTQTPEAQSIRYVSGILYAGDWSAGKLSIFDASNVRSLRLLASHPLIGFGDGIAIRGNLCLASTGHHAKTGDKSTQKNNGHALSLIDISNPEKPRTLSVFRFPAFFCRSSDFWTPRFAGNIAVAADSRNGVFLIDISNPETPRGIGQIRLPDVSSGYKSPQIPDAVSSIAVGDGVLYLTGLKTGLFLASIPGLKREKCNQQLTPEIPSQLAKKANPDFFSYDAGGRVRAVAVHGNSAWLAVGNAGIHIVRLSPKGIIPVGIFKASEVYDLKYSKGILYVAEGSNGFALYRPKANGTLELIGRKKLPENQLAQLIWKPDGSPFVILSSRSGHLYFFDVSDPSRVNLVFKHAQRSIIYGDLLCDQMLNHRYIAHNWHSGGIAWYDLKEKGKPVVANQVIERLNRHVDGMTALGDRLLMLNHGKYVLLEPNQSGPSINWTRHSADEYLKGIPTTNGFTVAISDSVNRTVRVYDFTQKTSAKSIPGRRWKFSDTPGSVCFWKDRLVIPLSYGGLLLEKNLPNSLKNNNSKTP
jgi:hypothetical protein